MLSRNAFSTWLNRMAGPKYNDRGGCVGCRVGAGKGLVAPLVHLLVSGGPSDQARAARALSNMATESTVKEQIVAAGTLFDILPLSTCCSHFYYASTSWTLVSSGVYHCFDVRYGSCCCRSSLA